MNNTEENIDRIQEPTREDIDRKEAERLLDEAFNPRTKPVDRKKIINSALKILIGLYKEKKDDLTSASFISIARAYYLVSITILPKGTTIPEKKKEALRKGIEFIDRAINKFNGSILDSQRAFRIKSVLSIEFNRIDREKCDNIKLKNLLNEAVDKGCTDFDTYEWDIQIAIRLCELGVDMEGHFDNLIKSNKANDLQKAKAYYFIKKDDHKAKEHMDKCTASLKYTPCSHRLWDETVGFIERLKGDSSTLWRDFAIKTYRSCRVQEKETGTLRLRWYWSRHRVLYDMAFLAVKEQADDEEPDVNVKQAKIKKLAEISDSLKSRFSLRLSDMEKMPKSDDESNHEFKKFLDKCVTAYQDGYVINRSEDKEGQGENKSTTSKQPEPRPQAKLLELTQVPEGWVVVHFYLNKLEGMGNAIVFDKCANSWQYKEFQYKELFEVFLTWQANYNLYKENAAEHLVTLCKKIGETMPFLFCDNFIPNGKDVLFVPHDFLHRLPLHGSIENKTNGKLFLENHSCCYLPAWSFASEKEASTSDEYVLLKNFDQGHFETLQNNQIWGTQSVKDGASSDDLENIRNNPRLLTILCHGEANMSNPFRSMLKLANGGITYLEILNSVKGLKGSQVILGACETDLVPPLSDVMDEHYSVATALLLIGAAGVVGTMWKVRSNKTKSLIEWKLENIEYKLNEWQKETGGAAYKDHPPTFYRSIAFRSIGFPL
ncbi:MAG: CHAT domain-containing protein [Candidatus Scalindua rubra]|uniref:CHAT domain protein n=2 Tax=Candidatus Scalindua brodae TaxID=237368 RepID=A0A0B0EKL4_9BACT|nr:Chain D, CHAT domain protein [Candidatus Scalindua brodae]7XC7_D Chain D, CHAT domain protein [Candidatus Scalindua brodae]7XSQ_B Chain B, CHAT domain protein [Candidatus Scalindua brodae]7XSR_C Chain C, CHAT domain protein [Candidatus Scalindua brodae]7XSS_C Chain C, CHAT domain protein [Candidatus Scalindua brodae]7XT4_C Chain C, CHAT domain protein [Candidatus Scalindua brodae]7Y8T_B Chain B, CHAT domain protein [Candidatus Scalindua brodae]7Y8Y_B Chain B, CHAT domain protein [Candidat